MKIAATLLLLVTPVFSGGASALPRRPSPVSAGAALNFGKARGPCQDILPQAAKYSMSIYANRRFKTRVAGFRLWANAVKWTPVRTKATEKFDVALDHVADNLQVVVMTQRSPAPLSSLADFALQNARKSDPNSTITAVENRVVNGHELVGVTYESTLKAGPMTFYGYLYSEDQGTIEVIAMAPQNLFQVHRAELTELLNGLEILPPDTPGNEALPGPQAAGPEDMAEIDPLLVRPGKDPAPSQWARLIRPPLPGAVSSGAKGGALSQPARPDASPALSRAPLSIGDTGSATGPAVATAVDSRPIPLNRPRPNYTEDARWGRVEGIIRIRALVGANGSARDVRLLTHLPDGLDEEAILAVRQMQFKPAMKDNEPVAFWVTIEVEFNLCGNCVPARPK